MYRKEANGFIDEELKQLNRIITEEIMKKKAKLFDLTEKRQQVFEKVQEKQEKLQQKINEKCKNQKTFHIGEKVLLRDTTLKKQWSGKLKPKWKGPYRIYQVIGKGAYKL